MRVKMEFTQHTVAKTILDKYIVSIISKCLYVCLYSSPISHFYNIFKFYYKKLCAYVQRNRWDEQTSNFKLCWLKFLGMHFLVKLRKFSWVCSFPRNNFPFYKKKKNKCAFTCNFLSRRLSASIPCFKFCIITKQKPND